MKVFYADYDKDEEIPSSEPVEMTLEEALQSFGDLTDNDDNFWGISVDENRTLQFMFTAEDNWIVDIPNQELRGSHTKECTLAQCIALIKEIYNKNDLVVPVDFSFEKW